MSYDEIKLNYDLAEAMVRMFRQSVEELEDTMQEMQSIANTLEEGALIGRGGTMYADAIRNNLIPALGKLTDKLEELGYDVHAAIESMREADSASGSMFQ